jgi:hypothetical protein
MLSAMNDGTRSIAGATVSWRSKRNIQRTYKNAMEDVGEWLWTYHDILHYRICHDCHTGLATRYSRGCQPPAAGCPLFAMFIFCNPDADMSSFPNFVTPSAGKSDSCGRNCGPVKNEGFHHI